MLEQELPIVITIDGARTVAARANKTKRFVQNVHENRAVGVVGQFSN
jgi:hypothetical protein